MAIDEFSVENPINHSSGRWNRLLLLKKNDPSYSKVEKLFHQGWKHPKKRPKPHVYRIFKIISPEALLNPYIEYRDRIREIPSVKMSKNPGNECLLFHGTNRSCSLGDDKSNVRLCNQPECSLCSIIRKSFEIKHCGQKHKFSRFGKGVYTTACSSKADDYSSDGKESDLHVLLLNRVVVGRAFKSRKNAQALIEPPFGYHSVIGEPGEDLNYEETVVYNNDAIRPAYLVVYGPQASPSMERSKSKFRAVLKELFTTPLAS